ncbi:hypothetical protein CA13_11830 [Planctomycetes bacterium CA13]|uniref:Uncharacterized protein n=1 Tax=Novipirellula herctigrandis TaxID=2527986 RepID=A0A5C5YYL9_9BACT|nr:hypothetical protein CA13_11830 [Planctomycetes bacterium CA13]
MTVRQALCEDAVLWSFLGCMDAQGSSRRKLFREAAEPFDLLASNHRICVSLVGKSRVEKGRVNESKYERELFQAWEGTVATQRS